MSSSSFLTPAAREKIYKFDSTLFARDSILNAPRPSPEKHYRLTEPLCKPLHEFSESEMDGLVQELREDGYEERETEIASLVESLYQRWLGECHNDPHKYSTVSFNRPYDVVFPSSLCGQNAPVSATVAYTQTAAFTITVKLPYWLPKEYVKGFAERQIRDQIQEG